MIRAMDRQQMNIFGEDVRKRVRDRLQEWPRLVRAAERLERLIEEDRKSIERLDDRITSTIIPRYDTLDMPRGSGISDKTGNLAADIVDKRDELQMRILSRELELADVRRRIREIEAAVSELNPRDAEVVRRYFLLRERWESICVRMNMSKSRLYEVLDHAMDVLGDLL